MFIFCNAESQTGDFMMDRNMIVTCGFGGWYPRGVARLIESVKHYGVQVFAKTEYEDGIPHHNGNPYAHKLGVMSKAVRADIVTFLWCDASIYAVNNPEEVFDTIRRDGYYLVKSGFNCAQSCNDRILEYHGCTRDEAEQMPECLSGFVGLDLTNPIGWQMFSTWIKYCNDGVFRGSRLHANQSSDPRFLFHRQDQSALSLIANRMGLHMHELNTHIGYAAHGGGDHNLFLCQGM